MSTSFGPNPAPAMSPEAPLPADDNFPATEASLRTSLQSAGPGEDGAQTSEPKKSLRQKMSIKGMRLSAADGSEISLDDLQGDEVCMSKSEFDSLRKNISTKGTTAKRLRIYLGIAFVVIFILACVSFAMSLLAAEVSKESHVEGSNLVNKEGKAVQVASSDVKVTDDGMMVKQCSGEEEGSCSSKPIATKLNKEKHALTSVIPDHLLHEMSEITLTAADETSTLNLRVLAVMRVVTPGSKCGTIVKFHTSIGYVSFDDALVSADSEAAAALENAGFDLEDTSTSTGSRRLSDGIASTGFFSFFEDYVWTCDSLHKPDYFKPPFRAVFKQVYPCYGNACESSARLLGEHIKKPGYDHALNAIVTTDVLVKTETRMAQHAFLPNHPGQALVVVTDQTAKTTFKYQINLAGSPIKCDAAPVPLPTNCDPTQAVNCTNYEAPELDMAADYTPVFLKEEDGARKFKLVPNPSSEEKRIPPFEYWDDADTFLPKFFKLIDARAQNAEMESTEVMESTHMTAAEADEYIDGLLSLANNCPNRTRDENLNLTVMGSEGPELSVDGTLSPPPKISDPDDPIVEEESSVKYYKVALGQSWSPAGSEKEGQLRAAMLEEAVADSYWKAFLEGKADPEGNTGFATFFAATVDESRRRLEAVALPGLHGEDNEGAVVAPKNSSERALLSRRLGVDFNVDIPLPPYNLKFSWGTGSGQFCVSAGVTQSFPGSLWWISGSCSWCANTGGSCYMCVGITLGLPDWGCGFEASMCGGVYYDGGYGIFASASIGGGCAGLGASGSLSLYLGVCPGHNYAKVKAEVKLSFSTWWWSWTIYHYKDTIMESYLGYCY